VRDPICSTLALGCALALLPEYAGGGPGSFSRSSSRLESGRLGGSGEETSSRISNRIEGVDVPGRSGSSTIVSKGSLTNV